MIVAISGGLGSGKTCMLTRYGCISNRNLGRELISNYHYINIPYQKLDLVDMYLNQPDLRDIIICGDELYTFMDCRMSTTKRNRLEGYLVAQTRKKNADLYFTTQFTSFVDIRLIRFVDVFITMKNIWLIDKDTGFKYKHPYKFKCRMLDYRGDVPTERIFLFDGRIWFDEYDTNEVIYPPDDYIKTNQELSKKGNKPRIQNDVLTDE